MALTPLETIAQKLADKRKEDLESILRISGSAAVSKNEYGVTIIDEQNVASSLVFKPLTKTKIDNVELLKAIDVEVKELKPNIPTRNLDLVPIYGGYVSYQLFWGKKNYANRDLNH